MNYLKISTIMIKIKPYLHCSSNLVGHSKRTLSFIRTRQTEKPSHDEINERQKTYSVAHSFTCLWYCYMFMYYKRRKVSIFYFMSFLSNKNSIRCVNNCSWNTAKYFLDRRKLFFSRYEWSLNSLNESLYSSWLNMFPWF